MFKYCKREFIDEFLVAHSIGSFFGPFSIVG
jgi:hypothetical protein